VRRLISVLSSWKGVLLKGPALKKGSIRQYLQEARMTRDEGRVSKANEDDDKGMDTKAS